MDIKSYEEHKKMQETHWWFRGKKDIVLDFAEKQAGLSFKQENQKILDVGCGMGLMLNVLKDYGDVYGMDVEQIAVEYCLESYKDLKNKVKIGALPDEVPFNNESFDYVFALDVFEHVYDDRAAMKKVLNLLRPGGKLIITVPALMSMWSHHDEFNHHYRRYEKKELLEKISEVGFEIKRCSYYNVLLFLPAFLLRWIKNMFKIESSDVASVNTNSIFNEILYHIFSSEKKWLRNHDYMLPGVSLIMFAEKPLNARIE